jgi:plasmid stabilization system protein ParE
MLHPDTKRKIRAAFDALRVAPELGEPLRADLEGSWRLPVGRWRVVYAHSDHSLTIEAIGPRASIYEELTRIRRRRR